MDILTPVVDYTHKNYHTGKALDLFLGIGIILTFFKEFTWIMLRILALRLLRHWLLGCINQGLLRILGCRLCLEGNFLLILRLLYSLFYKKEGGALNKLRMVGALIGLVSLVASTGVFAWNFYKNFWGKWFVTLMNFGLN